jgi:excisionase family DNA binding protein
MAVHTLGPDTLAGSEQKTLREDVEKLVDLLEEEFSEEEFNELPPLEGVIESPLSREEIEGLSAKRHHLAFQRLREILEAQQETPSLTMKIGEKEVGLSLPRSFTSLMIEVLTEVAQGRAVSIDTEEEELTTSEAAELLNVSRPHLVKLLEEGEIPFHKVGTHRRVYREDVLEYKARQREEAEEAMQNLTDQAQELGLGY